MAAALIGVYAPYSLPLSDETLKRALLIFDELVFIDPVTPRVRSGRYDPATHQPHLPFQAEQYPPREWESSARTLEPLIAAGAARSFDPTPLLDADEVEHAMTDALQADMGRPETFELFAGSPPGWCMLRSRIPRSTFGFLHHQYSPRVFYDENLRRSFSSENGYHALFADGKPDQDFAGPPWPGSKAEVDDEFACVVPYYLGSSLALSLAAAACEQVGGILFTDSRPHLDLLRLRLEPAAPRPDQIGFEHPLVLLDSTLRAADLAALGIEQVVAMRGSLSEQMRAASAILAPLGGSGDPRSSLEDPVAAADVERLSFDVVEAFRQVAQRNPGPLYIRTMNRIVVLPSATESAAPIRIVWIEPEEREFAPGPDEFQLKPRPALSV